MSSTTSIPIYKIYYKNKSGQTKQLGYLNDLTQIIPNNVGININGSISLYNFTDTTKPKSYIYITNAEYTPTIYVLGFWFSVNGVDTYTLLNMLSPDYKLIVRNKILYDSANTFNIPLTNMYNMCALIFEENSLSKIVINDNIYPLVNSIPVNNTNIINIALGNDNNMDTKFNGYIGEIQLLNNSLFTGDKFNIDTLYLKLKYKKTIPITTLPVTTQPPPVVTQLPPVTTQLLPVTTQLPPVTTQPPPVITQPPPVEQPIIQSPEITQQIVEADETGLKIIPATKPQTTKPVTTMYITTTTNPPIQENTGLLIIF